jgi:hypothetical protein
MEVDLYWPEQRFAVELDLYETHGTRESFEEDRLRQKELPLEVARCPEASAWGAGSARS